MHSVRVLLVSVPFISVPTNPENFKFFLTLVVLLLVFALIEPF